MRKMMMMGSLAALGLVSFSAAGCAMGLPDWACVTLALLAVLMLLGTHGAKEGI